MIDRRRAAAELARRKKRRARLDPKRVLFGPQLAFATDTAQMVVASCSRRAGKSFALAYKFFKTSEAHPRCLMLYVVASRESAKDIMWPAFEKLEAEFDVKLKFNAHTGEVTFPSGARLKLVGGDTARETRKFRGPAYAFVAIDEAQNFDSRLLKDLIFSVCLPAMMDYGAEAQMYITGTPSPSCAGLYYDLCHRSDEILKSMAEDEFDVEETIPHHHWTFWDNPHIPDKEKFVSTMLRSQGWTKDHPTYKREWAGEWIRDEHGMVYELNWAKNVAPNSFKHYVGLAEDWVYTLGIDVGVSSATSFSVVAHSNDLGQAYVVRTRNYGGKAKRPDGSVVSSNLTNAHIAALIEQTSQEFDIARTIMDTGGMGAQTALNLQQEHGVFVEPAKKSKKIAHIKSLNSDLRTGALRICQPDNAELLAEMVELPWDPDAMDRGTLVEDTPRFPNHACDATLYAWRGGMHADFAMEARAPAAGSAEAVALREAEELEAAKQRARANMHPETASLASDMSDFAWGIADTEIY